MHIYSQAFGEKYEYDAFVRIIALDNFFVMCVCQKCRSNIVEKSFLKEHKQ